MPLRIELRSDGRDFDGVETSWTAMDSALAGRENEFPMLARIDPYNFLEYRGEQIAGLRLEVECLLADPRDAPTSLLNTLLRLCDIASTDSHADLNFVGD